VRPELDAARAGFGSEGVKAGVVASDATDGTALVSGYPLLDLQSSGHRVKLKIHFEIKYLF